MWVPLQPFVKVSICLWCIRVIRLFAKLLSTTPSRNGHGARTPCLNTRKFWFSFSFLLVDFVHAVVLKNSVSIHKSSCVPANTQTSKNCFLHIIQSSTKRNLKKITLKKELPPQPPNVYWVYTDTPKYAPIHHTLTRNIDSTKYTCIYACIHILMYT